MSTELSLDLAKNEALLQICKELKCSQVTSRSIITRCIYCGDSQRKLENYGHFYIFRHAPIATCFRCGTTVSLKKWLRDLKLEKPELTELVNQVEAGLPETYKFTRSTTGNLGSNQPAFNTKQKVLAALGLSEVKENQTNLVFEVLRVRLSKSSLSKQKQETFLNHITLHYSTALNELCSVVKNNATNELYFAIFGYNEVLLRKLEPHSLELTSFQTLKTFDWPHFTPFLLTLGYTPSFFANVAIVENFFDCLALSYHIPISVCFLSHGKRNLLTTIFSATKLVGRKRYELYLGIDKDAIDYVANLTSKSFLNNLLKKNFSTTYLVLPQTDDLWQDLTLELEPTLKLLGGK